MKFVNKYTALEYSLQHSTLVNAYGHNNYG